MSHRTCLLTALLLALPALVGGSEEAHARAPAGTMTWRLQADDFVHYRIETLEWKDSRNEQRPHWGQIDSIAGFHGYELGEKARRVERAVTHPQLLHAPFVFTLPPKAKPGAKVLFRETLGGTWRMRAFSARGQVVVTEADDTPEGLVPLEGEVAFGEAEDAGPLAYRRLVSGRLAWTARFDPARGLMTQVEYHLSWATDQGTELRPKSAHAVRAEARQRDVKVRMTLDRVFTHRYRGFQRDVDRAIEAGLQYLQSRQNRDGSWGRFGLTTLALLALVDGGRAADHPVVKRGFDWMLAQQPWQGELRRHAVYAMSVALMAIERRRTPAVEVERRRKGLVAAFLPRRLTGRERAWMSRCVGFLIDEVRIERPNGDRRGPVTGDVVQERWRWGYGRLDRPTYWDNSNTQYAVLGLESAARCGIPVPRRAWHGIARHFLHAQARDGRARRDLLLVHAQPPRPKAKGETRPGTRSRAPVRARSRGWRYHLPPQRDPGTPPTSFTYGAMTAAGIGSLAIARSRIEGGSNARWHRELVTEIDQAILDGFASLDDMFSVWMHPRYEGWYTYYLYGLERAGRLTSVERFGGHDWYWEGAMQLLLRQSNYGHGDHRYWSYDLHGEGSTAWAILFLKRGTPPVVTPR